MAIEIVDFPIKNGDFPWLFVSSPEGKLSPSKTPGCLQKDHHVNGVGVGSPRDGA